MRAVWITLIAYAALSSPVTLAQRASESCVGRVRLRGPLWDSTSGTLEVGLDAVLASAAHTIRERCAGKTILIEGHTYEMPAPDLNQKLSELRAVLVQHELVRRGVPAVQLIAIGLGDTRPLTPLDTPDAALENRRITFLVID